MKRFLILGLLLTSCGSELDPYKPSPPTPPVYTPPPVTHVDEAIEEYYDEFVEECYEREHEECISIVERRLLESVKVVDEATLRKDPGSENRVGVCYTWTSNGKLVRAQIEILEHNGYNKQWDPDSLRGLMYHELGHCLLGLNHVCEMKDDNGNVNPDCKKDLSNPHMMFPSMYSAQTYRDASLWDKMIDEMFTTVGKWLAMFLDYFEPEDDTIIKHTWE